MEGNKLYSIAEAAEILDIAPNKVYKLIYKNTLGSINSMNKMKVSTLHIQAYMNKLKNEFDVYYNSVAIKLLEK